MRLKTHTDSSYLTEPQAKSRAASFHYLGNNPGKPDPPQQAAVLAQTNVMKNVNMLALAAEAEIGTTFEGGQHVVVLQTLLAEMGHPQQGTPIQVDNSTAYAFANNTLKQHRSSTIDMRFYWVQDPLKKGSLSFTGSPERRTWPTTLPSTSLQLTTGVIDHNISLLMDEETINNGNNTPLILTW